MREAYTGRKGGRGESGSERLGSTQKLGEAPFLLGRHSFSRAKAHELPTVKSEAGNGGLIVGINGDLRGGHHAQRSSPWVQGAKYARDCDPVRPDGKLCRSPLNSNPNI